MSDEDMKRVVEIDGVKIEVDLRTARRVGVFRVGDIVKVLIPGGSYGTDKTHVGAIIGFDEFKDLPTLVVAYLNDEYGKVSVKMAYINKNSKNEIVHANPEDVPVSKEHALELLDRDISEKQRELEKAQWHKARFLDWFGKHFDAMTQPAQTSAD